MRLTSRLIGERIEDDVALRVGDLKGEPLKGMRLGGFHVSVTSVDEVVPNIDPASFDSERDEESYLS